MKKRFSISTILLSLIAWFAIAPSLVSSAEQATLELVAGGGTTLEGKATKCKISQPFGIAFDAQDNMFICEETHRLLRVDAKTGDLTAVSKAGAKDDDIGDGKVAAKACFSAPHNLVSDAQGNLFIADTMHFRVRRVDAKMQMVTTIAGTGAKELSGDGGGARWNRVHLFQPRFHKALSRWLQQGDSCDRHEDGHHRHRERAWRKSRRHGGFKRRCLRRSRQRIAHAGHRRQDAHARRQVSESAAERCETSLG